HEKQGDNRTLGKTPTIFHQQSFMEEVLRLSRELYKANSGKIKKRISFRHMAEYLGFIARTGASRNRGAVRKRKSLTDRRLSIICSTIQCCRVVYEREGQTE